jgi:hypothetical protein
MDRPSKRHELSFVLPDDEDFGTKSLYGYHFQLYKTLKKYMEYINFYHYNIADIDNF